MNRRLLSALALGVILPLPGSLIAQAPWEVNAPIVSVSRQLYKAHPKPKVAVNVTRKYVGPGLELEEMMSWQAASDTPYHPQRRWSSDNGRTWSDFEPLPETISHIGSARIYWGAGSVAYDSASRKTVSIWLRQTQLGDGRAYNHCFLRISENLGRTWGGPQLLKYEPGADLDPADPLNSDFLNNNQAYFPQNIELLRDESLLVAGAAACIGDDVSLSELNPHNISAYFAPADSRNLGGVNFVGRWNPGEARYDWTASDVIWAPRHVASRGLMEPSVAELTDGRWLTVYRCSNQNITDHDDGRKRYTLSTEGGTTLSDLMELAYDDGTRFYSPSSIHQLIRHSQTGKLYWIGNISTSPVNGNLPRYPLVIAEVDEVNVALKRDTVTLIDTRRSGESSSLQLSNFSVIENRQTNQFEIMLTRLGADPSDFWGSDVYRYTLTLPSTVPSEDYLEKKQNNRNAQRDGRLRESSAFVFRAVH
ncbi:MAG: exo-alpha-sialidase [Deltaproteobacteria bacterium]|nr:exo-alpha-sialidase [Deltaproteobacteria bacterium]